MAGKNPDNYRVQEARWKRALCFNEIAVQLTEAIEHTVRIRSQYQRATDEYKLHAYRITELQGMHSMYKRMEREDMK